MSDIGISYDASCQPSPVGARIGLGISGTTLKATLQDIDNFVILLTPSGNVGEQILSGIAWPLAQTLGATLPSLAKSLFYGYSFDVMSITPTQVNIEGENLTVAPANLSMSAAGGYLLIEGSVNVS